MILIFEKISATHSYLNLIENLYLVKKITGHESQYGFMVLLFPALLKSVSEGSPRVPARACGHTPNTVKSGAAAAAAAGRSLPPHSDMAHMTGARSCITHLTGGCRPEASAKQTMVRYETSWTLVKNGSLEMVWWPVCVSAITQQCVLTSDHNFLFKQR